MAPPSAEESASIVTLDPDGDCLLSIKNQNSVSRFLVSSNVLSLASPAFRAYFKSLALESKPYDLSILAPAKYDDLSLGLLMQICHFQRASPIPFVPLERLYNLAITAYKFSLVTPVEPWVTIWTTPLISDLVFNNPKEIEMWLSIASVFNQEQMFQRVTQKAILSYTSEFLDKIDSGSIHRVVVDEIRDIRMNAIGKLIALARSLVDKIMAPESICAQPEMAAQCDAVLLGSALKGIKSLKLYPFPQKAPYPGMTVEKLGSALMSLSFFCFEGHKQTCQATADKEYEYLRGAIQKELSLLVGLDIRNFPVTWGDCSELPFSSNRQPINGSRAADSEGTPPGAPRVATRIGGGSSTKVEGSSSTGTVKPRAGPPGVTSPDRVARSNVVSPSGIAAGPKPPVTVPATSVRTRLYYPVRLGSGSTTKNAVVGKESPTGLTVLNKERALADANGNPSATQRLDCVTAPGDTSAPHLAKHTIGRVGLGDHAPKVSGAHGMPESQVASRPSTNVAEATQLQQNSQVKRLSGLFPKVKTEVLIEILKFNNWDAQSASLFLAGAGGPPERIARVAEPNISAPPAGEVEFKVEHPVTVVTGKAESTSSSPLITLASSTNQVQSIGPTPAYIPPHLMMTPTKLSQSRASTPTVAGPATKINKASDVPGTPGVNKSPPKPPRYEPNWTDKEHDAIGKEVLLAENSALLKEIIFRFPNADSKALLTYLFRAGWNLNVAIQAVVKAGLAGEATEQQGK